MAGLDRATVGYSATRSAARIGFLHGQADNDADQTSRRSDSHPI
jgi:hypothetical protein